MKEMSEPEAVELVLSILKGSDHPLTTREIEAKVTAQGSQCPDSAARFLNKLRFKGQINGELSMEKRGWIWWIDQNSI